MSSTEGGLDLQAELESGYDNLNGNKENVLKDSEIYGPVIKVLEGYESKEVRAGEIYEDSELEPSEFAKGTQLEDNHRMKYESKIGKLLSAFSILGIIECSNGHFRSYMIPEELPHGLEWSDVEEELDSYEAE